MTISFTLTRARLPLIAMVAFATVLAVAGATLAIKSFAGDGTAHGHSVPSGPATAGQGIPTSFGAVAMEYAVRLSGLTSKDLAGMTHGVKNYVPPESSQVQVAVTIANQLEDTVDYTPGQFRLIANDGGLPTPGDERIVPVGATFQAGTLQPDAAIEGSVRFVVPNKRAHLWAEFDDPKRAEPVLVDLGRPTAVLPGAPQRKQPAMPAPPTSFDGTSPQAQDHGH